MKFQIKNFKMNVTATKGRIIVFILGICAVVALCIGLLLTAFSEHILRHFMKKDLTLKPGAEFFDIWKDLPIPLYEKIYVFNITNPEEFEMKGHKPILKELGPYVFRGKWVKEEMTWNDTEGTVTYKDVKEYTFIRELSVGDQEEEIYTLNGPLLAVINYIEDNAPFFFRSFIAELVNGIFESYNETLLVHRPIREIVYDGYHEPMVADLTKVVENFLTLPLKLINDTFGVLHEKKHLGDGVFKIKSGFKGIEDYAAIQEWNNKSYVDWWDDDHCNKINGTDGFLFAPGVTSERKLSIFNPNLCRNIPLRYIRDITVHGIRTLRFGMPPDTLSSGDVNPENKCYCKGPKCFSGILPLNCKKGAPYVISLPHFLYGDEKLKTAVEGVNPSKEMHSTYIDVEPTAGLTLNAAIRIQLNGVTRRLPAYKPLKYVSDCIVPVLWMSEEAQLDVYFANYFKSRVQTPILVFKVLCRALVAIGGFWAGASLMFLFCIQAKVKPEKFKQSFVLKTLNSVYTNVSMWPAPEDGMKEANASEKTNL